MQKKTNVVLDTFFSIQVVIPENQPDFTQYFTTSLDLSDPSIMYCITHVSVIIDTSGIYNIPLNTIESVTVGSGTVRFGPGWYGVTELTSMLPITIPLAGENAYKCKNNLQRLSFTNAPTVKKILGFTNDEISESEIADRLVDVTVGYDTAMFSCDLIQLASAVSQVYFDVVAVNPSQPGKVVTDSTDVLIPLLKKNPSSVRWRIHNRYGDPFLINTPVTVHLDISGWKVL